VNQYGSHLAFDGLSFTMYHSVRSNNAIRRWISLDHFELDRTHASTYQKYIAFVYWPVRLQKVRL